jgi:predicted transcriptional regulator
MSGEIDLKDPILTARLEAAARRRGVSPDMLAAEAIASFLDIEEDFRSAVEQGVREADSGVFATAEEVNSVLRPKA